MMQAIKHFTLLTLMVGLCGSCARTPLADEANGEPDQISFSTKVANEQLDNQEEPWSAWSQSKGTPLNPATDLMPSMGMFCYVTTEQWAIAAPTAKPEKMNNVPLHSRKDGATVYWEYEPDQTVTWMNIPYPSNVTFFGYSPVATADNGVSVLSDFSPTGVSVGAPVLRYTVPTDALKQPDLMVAIPRKDMMRTKNDVQLVYRKALTTIAFSIKGSKGQKVKNIYLKGISLQGDLSLDIDPVTPVVWSNLQPVSNTPIYLGKTAGVVQAQVNTGTPVQSANGYLMMIPQALTADAMAVVELEGEPARSYSLAALNEQWTPGRSLTYTLLLDETTLVVTPADWLDVAATAGFVDVTVSGANWTAVVEGSGLSISPTTGGGTSTTVRVSWTANFGMVEPGTRYGTVTFAANSSGYGKYEFQTSQLGAGPDWIEYNGVKWAKGNLIANGTNDCKIGAPTDGGLYFQFGSLIGFKGGSDGTGVGRVEPTWSYKYWDGAADYDAEREIAVWPVELTAADGDKKPAAWPNYKTTDKDLTIRASFFDCRGYPYDDNNTYYLNNMIPFRNYSGLVAGQYAKKGVGDPCTYYLGPDWQTPSRDNWHSLCNYALGNPWSDPSLVGAEIEADVAKKDNIYFAHKQITIPISGARSDNNGKFTGLTKLSTGGSPYTQYWATEVRGGMSGWTFWYQYDYTPEDMIDIYSAARPSGLPVRCVYNK